MVFVMRNRKGEFNRHLRSEASRRTAVHRRASIILCFDGRNRYDVTQVDSFPIVEDDRLSLKVTRPAIIIESDKDDGKQLGWTAAIFSMHVGNLFFDTIGKLRRSLNVVAYRNKGLHRKIQLRL